MEALKSLFQYLERTPSRNLKQYAIDQFRNAMGTQAGDDLNYCLEVLDGRWKTGYTYYRVCSHAPFNKEISDRALRTDLSLEGFLRPVFNPTGRDEATIHMICKAFREFQDFIEPLVNRKWRLGIGKSLLGVKEAAPMLAKKYEVGKLPRSKAGYYITEKLDGNRCIAQWVEEQDRWVFTSRSGKEMRVQFNMRDMPKEYIYDGEVLSRDQIKNPGQANFNALSGAVNSKYGDKSDLVYMVFDIIASAVPYSVRRHKLETIKQKVELYNCIESLEVMILPILQYCTDERDLEHAIPYCLDSVTKAGGEGLMINVGDRYYEQKRTDAILKVKETQTMDMLVCELTEGTGKHEGLVGALVCECEGEGGKQYICRVGSGLSDEQRARWAEYPEEIIGHVIEVAYFSISQDKASRGTKYYSLRFPRLKRVRDDKEDTSEY